MSSLMEEIHANVALTQAIENDYPRFLKEARVEDTPFARVTYYYEVLKSIREEPSLTDELRKRGEEVCVGHFLKAKLEIERDWRIILFP